MTLQARLAAMAAGLALTGALAPTVVLAADPPSAAAVADEAKARAMLTKTIAAINAGTPNYDDMAPQLATAVQGQMGSMDSLRVLGAPSALDRVGDGTAPYQYKAAYPAGAVLTWSITLSPDGKIAGLFVH